MCILYFTKRSSVYLPKIDFTHQNPVVAGIVDSTEEYLYSSAGDYCLGRSAAC
jgi:hypothetical protein